MASRRILKKNINYLASELITECLAFQHFNQSIPTEKVEDAVNKILDKRVEVMSLTNKALGEQDKKAVKEHFVAIRKEVESFISCVEELASAKK